jgi:hypothetical protein
MKSIVLALAFALICAGSLSASEHLLQGPYGYDESGKAQPRFYMLDGKMYSNINNLKATIAHFPAGSNVHLHGGCQPHTALELGPHPYVSLSAFRRFCSEHHVEFDWYYSY